MKIYYCSICREEWDEYNDCKSHVYTVHGGEECGIAKDHPETFVEWGEPL